MTQGWTVFHDFIAGGNSSLLQLIQAILHVNFDPKSKVLLENTINNICYSEVGGHLSTGIFKIGPQLPKIALSLRIKAASSFLSKVPNAIHSILI